MDLQRGPRWGEDTSDSLYWVDCKTSCRSYDQAVMLANIALKHHLVNQVELNIQGA